MPEEGAWSIQKAEELYCIDRWSQGYFTVNELGNVCVKPASDSPIKIDLKKLVSELRQRKICPPILIRFTDILKDRLKLLSQCFYKAIADNKYRASYAPLFPIKVNQEKDVVTSVLRFGRQWGVGLEVGSKAELLIALAQAQEMATPIVCNGYKDSEFVELVAMAHKMGKHIFAVIENFGEIISFIQYYKKTGVIPNLGIRVKPTTKGTGQWAKTGGDASKFGLRIPQVMRALHLLKREGLLDSLKLLHFHVGSQIMNISVVKQSILETTRVYVEMIKLGAKLEYIDIGGGLGVNYSTDVGSNTINYTVEEYANDVVYRIMQICDEHHIPHPKLYSESGRFLAAHYSMLITDISATSALPEHDEDFKPPLEDFGPLHEMHEILSTLREDNIMECYHDAFQYKQEALNMFNLGYMGLADRSTMESLFWAIMRRILVLSKKHGLITEELQTLEGQLSDIYYTNFSLFQSLPDAWAINQIFPIMPIHRLNEEPTRRGVIADLTCDSDGIIGRYLSAKGDRVSLPLHEFHTDEPYYVGLFLTGAYQETLGELHNLFGDPHAVLIEIGGENQYRMSDLVTGDSIDQVISYMSYDTKKLRSKMREQLEAAVEDNRLSLEDSAHMMDSFESGMLGYTYFKL